MAESRPNIVFVFGDQWRQQAMGFAGDSNLRGHTPRLDGLAGESAVLTDAVAGCPVCSPYRASFLTGQYPDRHGVFLNDVRLGRTGVQLGEAFAAGGYRTGYIGKWHVDGDDRGGFIPPQRRAGFDFWEVLECTHEYNDSWYWGIDDRLHRWEGYDAIDQTRHACRFLREQADATEPFLLVLSWGPPHAPYGTAPKSCRQRFDPQNIELRPNVPPGQADVARQALAGYYAHIAALDDCLGKLLDTLDATGQAEHTVFVLTSDHGDMLYSQGATKKQQPWEESVRVPFLLRWPGGIRPGERRIAIDAPDLMPTLLGLAGLEVPESVQGRDLSQPLRSGQDPDDDAALLACYAPFGQWGRAAGGREYRGLRTTRYTYVRTPAGPWLLLDNQQDPFQQNNLVDSPDHRELRDRLEKRLQTRLAELGDDFPTGPELIRRWEYDRTYAFDENETVRYRNFRPPG